MDEYISMNDDTGFITESDIDNLCKIVDLHALMIQESYDEDLETVESYIESVISNYFNDIKAVQESDSEEVFIDPRVVKAAKTYKHNKENPSSTVFIDPTAINAMAYRRNSKEYTKNLLKPAIEAIVKNPNVKHVKLSDIDPYEKLHDAEGHVNTANREKKELEDIKNHKAKDDPKFADLNKFMYDKMSDDRNERLKKLSSVKPGKFNPGKKYRMEGVEMNDEFIIMDDDVDDVVEESYDDISLDDVETYLECVKDNIADAIELHDDMIQEGYEYEDMSVEDLEMFIESAIDDYNDGVDLYNDMIMESDDNLTDDVEEARDPSWSGENNGSDPRADRRKYMNDPNVQPWDKKQILDRANKADDLSLKRVIRRSHRDNVEEMPSRQYLMWKKDRDTWNDVADRDENEGLTHVAATSRKRANESQKLMNDIKDQRLAGRRASVNEYALTSYRDNELDLELEEPLTVYEFFDDSYEPDNTPIIPRSCEEIEFTQEVTLAELTVITAAAVGAIKVGHKLIDQLIVHRKFGRFPKDMKRLYDVLGSENFKASENKRSLKKALKALSKDLVWMLSPGMYSRWKLTPNEKAALKKLQKHVNDLYLNKFMLTRSETLSNKRRIPERLEELVQQGNKVLHILNNTIYKKSDDVTTEWMV